MKNKSNSFGKPTQKIKQNFLEQQKTTYCFKQLRDYLIENNYTPSYRRGNKDAFYNGKTNLEVLIPFNQEAFTKQQIIQIFQEDNATELPPQIEWCRFQVFIYSQFNLKNKQS